MAGGSAAGGSVYGALTCCSAVCRVPARRPSCGRLSVRGVAPRPGWKGPPPCALPWLDAHCTQQERTSALTKQTSGSPRHPKDFGGAPALHRRACQGAPPRAPSPDERRGMLHAACRRGAPTTTRQGRTRDDGNERDSLTYTDTCRHLGLLPGVQRAPRAQLKLTCVVTWLEGRLPPVRLLQGAVAPLPPLLPAAAVPRTLPPRAPDLRAERSLTDDQAGSAPRAA